MMDKAMTGSRRRGVRPRPAATIVLTRTGKTGREVLMGRRPRTMKFLPGKYVFPGGRVERDDARFRPEHLMPEPVAARVGPRAQALGLAAIRETFEETGLVLGHPGAPATPVPALWQPFVAAGFMPALDRLRPVARAITPVGVPMRFDTWFFVADVDGMDLTTLPLAHDVIEMEDIAWVTPEEAATLDVLDVTQAVLDQVIERDVKGLDDMTAPIRFYRKRDRHFLIGTL